MRGETKEGEVRLAVRALHVDRGLAVTPAIGAPLGTGYCVTHAVSGKKIHAGTYCRRGEEAVLFMGQLLETGIDWTQGPEEIERAWRRLPLTQREALMERCDVDGCLWVRDDSYP